MTVKGWLVHLQSVQICIILFFTSTFFIIEMIASYVTHSLTLLLHSYYTLCNIIAFIGCITTVKETNKDGEMKSTFGWARIDIVTMLVCSVFFASFCFSLLIEAVQTLIHIDHLDAMHYPILILSIGVVGILLHVVSYMYIGDYTLNQATYLQFTKAGVASIPRCLNNEILLTAKQTTKHNTVIFSKGNGIRDMCREFLACIFIITDSLLVYFAEKTYSARFIDPILAIIASILLLIFSYSYIKKSGLILLQTIPNHINIYSLKRELLEAFPGVINAHDLHVWQLKSEDIISTAHIIFLDPLVYGSITDEVVTFFIEIGITQVTVQPEFHKVI